MSYETDPFDFSITFKASLLVSSKTSFNETFRVDATFLQSSYSGETLTTFPFHRASLKRIFPCFVRRITISRSARALSSSCHLRPRVVVSFSKSSVTEDSFSHGAITVRSVAGRFFFIRIGVRNTSRTPMDRSFSIT